MMMQSTTNPDRQYDAGPQGRSLGGTTSFSSDL